MSPDGSPRARVVIAGGGLAGVEAALALRALGPDRAAVTVLDPRGRFVVPATAASHAFGVGWSIDRPLASVVQRAGARLRRARLVAVDGRRRLAMLAGGELLGYERLIVAVGARPEAPLADALTFRGHADAAELRSLVDGIAEHAARGAGSELAIVVPERCGWPLTAYEIALMVHEHLAAEHLADGCRITVVTAEEAPLATFGAEVGSTVTRTLARAGVAIRPATTVSGFRWGRLDLADGGMIAADRVVALPTLAGPRIDGLAVDEHGFIDCGPEGRVPGAAGVHVVGDAGRAEVRQGGLACRQADDAAAEIARELGAEPARPLPPATFDDADWDPAGRWHDHGDGRDVATSLPWPVPRLSGRFLTPFLNELSQPLPVL